MNLNKALNEIFKPTSLSYKVLFGIFSVLLTVFFGWLITITLAGNLNPTSPPADTLYTLEDIYHKLDKNAGAPTSYGIDSPGSPAGTMHTLTDIYGIAPSTLASPAAATDVCNSKTFYANPTMETKKTGTKTDCYRCYP